MTWVYRSKCSTIWIVTELSKQPQFLVTCPTHRFPSSLSLWTFFRYVSVGFSFYCFLFCCRLFVYVGKPRRGSEGNETCKNSIKTIRCFATTDKILSIVFNFTYECFFYSIKLRRLVMEATLLCDYQNWIQKWAGESWLIARDDKNAPSLSIFR